jgi:hypothetical protein
MEQEELKNYIEQALDSGATKEEVTEVLNDAGWDQEKITNVFSQIESKNDPVEEIISANDPNINIMKQTEEKIPRGHLVPPEQDNTLGQKETAIADDKIIDELKEEMPSPEDSFEPTEPDKPIEKEPCCPDGKCLPVFDTLLKRAWRVFKKNLGKFLGVGFFIGLLNILTIIILNGISIFRGVSTGSFNSFIIVITAILSIVFQSFFFSVLVASMISVVKDRKHAITLGATLKNGFKKGLSIWWVYVLAMVIIIGGSFLLIVPGIIFAVWFFFIEFNVIYKEKKGMAALLNSRDLVNGNFWEIFARIDIFLLIVFFVVGFLWVMFAWFTIAVFGPEMILGAIIFALLSVLLTVLALGFYASVFSLMFEDLLRSKENQRLPEITIGRKAKFLLVGLAGWVVGIVLFFFGAFNFLRQTTPNAVVPMPTANILEK